MHIGGSSLVYQRLKPGVSEKNIVYQRLKPGGESEKNTCSCSVLQLPSEIPPLKISVFLIHSLRA